MERFSPLGDSRFNGFREIEELDAGPLCLVYKAVERGTERRVTLQVLMVDSASPPISEVLEKNVLGLGDLWSHPNVATFLRSETGDASSPVLVFELCEESAATRLRSGPLSIPDVISLGVKVAGALETAHQLGHLHSDVKPKSIYFTAYDQPALADFGHSRLAAASQFTTGVFDFTSSHTPPEVLEGRQPTAQSDIYSLASTMYQLIAGRSPFRSSGEDSPAAVMMKILRDPPPPLPAGTPDGLAEIITTSLSKDPGDRPSSSAALGHLLNALERGLGLPETQYIVGPARRASEPERSRTSQVTVPRQADAVVREDQTLMEDSDPVAVESPPTTSFVGPPLDASLGVDQVEERCPSGHAVRAGVRFCGTCGLAVAIAPASSAGSGTRPDQGVACRNGHPAQLDGDPKPFCGVCGAPMIRRCTVDHPMPVQAKFCPTCGGPPRTS